MGVLGVDVSPEAAGQTNGHAASIDPFVGLLLDVRRSLREAKQWALADDIRNKLGELGVVVEDKPGGDSSWYLES